jgi:Mn-dependent DtxR family transcriptional regulator
MQQDDNKNKFDVNLDPEQTERLREIFGFNNKQPFGDFMVDSSKKEKFYDKIKKEQTKKNKNK